MPFPFAVLPYGLVQRLRELSTPSEAYDLQIAAGNYATDLKPFQLLEPVEAIDVFTDESQFVGVSTSLLYKFQEVSTIPTDVLYDVKHQLRLNNNVTEEVLNNPVFDKLYLKNITHLVVCSEKLTTQFLQKLAQKLPSSYSGSLRLELQEIQMSFVELLTFFPNIRHFTHLKLYDGWAHDLATSVKTKIHFNNGNIDETFMNVLTVNSDDIFQLLRKGCTIDVCCTVADDISLETSISKLKTVMGPRFTMVSGDSTDQSKFYVNMRKVNHSSKDNQTSSAVHDDVTFVLR